MSQKNKLSCIASKISFIDYLARNLVIKDTGSSGDTTSRFKTTDEKLDYCLDQLKVIEINLRKLSND